MKKKPPLVRSPKNNPIPVRFAPADEQILQKLTTRTGLPKVEIIRRAARYALPKFLNRKVDILDLPPLEEVAA